MTNPNDSLEQAGTRAEAEATGVPAEPEASAIGRLEAQVAELNDRHLRLAAEYDNYRKRAAREKAELGDRAQAALVGRLLDGLDDLHRALGSDPASTPADALRGAIEAVEMKLSKELQAAGLERVDPVGQRFDPAVAEAVSIVPAATAGQADTVSATFQAGYRFRGVLVRPARVQVYSAPSEA
ncbi:MAG TPA: nucleotide exchange factor GrpE [Gemmatimonadales bacterium]|nr:nucleotide exchange factor GrpE [Gemmatimonadales bacterium]